MKLPKSVLLISLAIIFILITSLINADIVLSEQSPRTISLSVDIFTPTEKPFTEEKIDAEMEWRIPTQYGKFSGISLINKNGSEQFILHILNFPVPFLNAPFLALSIHQKNGSDGEVERRAGPKISLNKIPFLCDIICSSFNVLSVAYLSDGYAFNDTSTRFYWETKRLNLMNMIELLSEGFFKINDNTLNDNFGQPQIWATFPRLPTPINKIQLGVEFKISDWKQIGSAVGINVFILDFKF